MSEARLRDDLAAFAEAGLGASFLDAAILVARTLDPDIDATAVDAELEGLAVGAMSAVSAAAPLSVRAASLCAFLKGACGFGGDPERYYEIDNSRIDRVLDTRRGLPIALAVIYVEVGRRYGLDAEGVNFPGHFLVRFADDSDTVLVDPFAGTRLDTDDCRRLLKVTQGEHAELSEAHFAPATALGVLVRMLNNLKQLALGESRHADALRFSDFILIAAPEMVFEHGDRAALYERLGKPELALAELAILRPHLSDARAQARLEEEVRRLTDLAGNARIVH